MGKIQILKNRQIIKKNALPARYEPSCPVIPVIKAIFLSDLTSSAQIMKNSNPNHKERNERNP